MIQIVTGHPADGTEAAPGRRRSDSAAGSPTMGRRASDRIDARGAARMLEVLSGRPSFDDVARELALGTLARLKPKFVVISHLAPTAQLNVIGSFGLNDADLTTLQARSVWDGSFMSEAVRTGSLAIIRDQLGASEGTWESEIDAQAFPIVALPLILKDQKVGALGIGVDEGLSAIDFSEELSGVDFALALYLSMNFEASSASQEAPATVTKPDPSSVDAPDELPTMTDRRREVLRLLSMGMTNSQIARRIGFSESTVRHETIALYRLLGARNRGEASRIAQMHGLLDD